MNNLNSVLFEGHLTDTPVSETVKNIQSCIFNLSSTRISERGTEVSVIKIVTYGALAERCGSLKKNRSVRVVGRLLQTENSVVILGEHVEFKPVEKI